MIRKLARKNRHQSFKNECQSQVPSTCLRGGALFDRRTTLPASAACFLLTALPAAIFAADQPWVAHGKNGMVAAESEHASQAGLAMLDAGGNAFDAVHLRFVHPVEELSPFESQIVLMLPGAVLPNGSTTGTQPAERGDVLVGEVPPREARAKVGSIGDMRHEMPPRMSTNASP